MCSVSICVCGRFVSANSSRTSSRSCKQQSGDAATAGGSSPASLHSAIWLPPFLPTHSSAVLQAGGRVTRQVEGSIELRRWCAAKGGGRRGPFAGRLPAHNWQVEGAAGAGAPARTRGATRCCCCCCCCCQRMLVQPARQSCGAPAAAAALAAASHPQ